MSTVKGRSWNGMRQHRAAAVEAVEDYLGQIEDTLKGMKDKSAFTPVISNVSVRFDTTKESVEATAHGKVSFYVVGASRQNPPEVASAEAVATLAEEEWDPVTKSYIPR